VRGQRPVHPVREDRGDRAKTNDPRPSVEARYKTFADYHGQVRRALTTWFQTACCCAKTPRAKRRGDAAGITRGVPAPEGGVLPAVQLLKACSEGRHHGRDHDR